jgi:hypothetical protein
MVAGSGNGADVVIEELNDTESDTGVDIVSSSVSANGPVTLPACGTVSLKPSEMTALGSVKLFEPIRSVVPNGVLVGST